MEVLASHSGKSDRREWHTVGAWLHPGERIVIALAPEMYEYIASAASNGCADAQRLIAKAEGRNE